MLEVKKVANHYQKVKSPTREIGGQSFVRIPVKTHCIMPGEDFVDVAFRYCKDLIQPGDVVLLCQKALATSQGRLIAAEEIRPRAAAKFFSSQLGAMNYSRGVGSAAVIEVAMQEIGAWRVMLSGIIQYATRIFGRSGDFTRILGSYASLIRDVEPHLPLPHNRFVFLPPCEPEAVAEKLGKRLGAQVCIVAANDFGQALVLAHTAGVDKKLVEQLLLDNPLGQGGTLHAMGIIRKVDSQSYIASRR